MKIELHSAEEVAETLGVELDTLYRYARTGRIHGMKVGKAWRFLDVDVEEFLQKNRYHSSGARSAAASANSHVEKSNQSFEVAYAEVETASDMLAADLLRRGFAPKSRVLILLSKSLEFMVGCLAVWKAGGVLISESPNLKGEALDFILHECQPQALIVDQDVADRLKKVRHGLDQVKAICVKTNETSSRGLAPFQIHCLDWLLPNGGVSMSSPLDDSPPEKISTLSYASRAFSHAGAKTRVL